MGSSDEWGNISAAADREPCSPQAICRRIKVGVLTARIEASTARDGRHTVKAWVWVSELDKVFGHAAREEHVRRIRATAQPLTRGQESALRKGFTIILQRSRRSGRDVGSAGRPWGAYRGIFVKSRQAG